MDTILLRVYKKRWKIFSNKVKRNKINSFKTKLDRSREIEKNTEGENMASVQTKDYIVQLIKEEILSGVMKPGEELAQEALAERLGVSRMPIREALQNLVQEGFAVRLPNRHIQAVVLSAQQIHDVFHVIAAMAAENTILVAKKEQMLRRKNVEQTSQTEFEEDGQSKLFLEQEIEKTPSEQLFQILSGMENALRPEKKAEWEMVYQERLISLFENPYLSQLQGKTMDGYVAYAIEKMGDKQQKLEQLRRITEGIAENSEQKIRMGLREYYLSYADAFVERWEKKAEETEK